MRDRAGTDHIQIDIQHAATQMMAGLHRRRMIAIFPESSFTFAPFIEILRSPACRQLHAPGYGLVHGILDQQMNVIAGHHIIKHRKMVSMNSFSQPIKPVRAVWGMFQQEFTIMATMR
jgi:hypothetical protein